MNRMIAGAVLAVAGLAGTASAQGLSYSPLSGGRPIDTNQLVVAPADTATNIFSGTSRFLSRVVANTIDSNGFVKTVNNLLGRSPSYPSTVQPGYSALPDPRTFPSSGYKNSFQPVLPTTMQYGSTPR